jgi:hypothetical protein
VDGRKGAGVEDGDAGRARSQLSVYSIMSGAASHVGEEGLLVLRRNSSAVENLVRVE